MANQKKGFVLYFDSLGLLNLFPPDQIGELMLALYDYAQRICEQEESPEEALFRYPTLHDATQVGFISMAAYILRDTHTWTPRQAQCRNSALKRHQPALSPQAEPIPLRDGIVTDKEVADALRTREAARTAAEAPEDPPVDPEVRRAYVEQIRRSLAGFGRPMDETPIDEIRPLPHPAE